MALSGATLLILGLGLAGWIGHYYIQSTPAVAQSEAATVAKAGQEMISNPGVRMLLAVLPLSIMGFAAINPSLQGILSLSTRESDQGEVLGLGQGLSALARILGPAVGIALCKPDHIYWPHISAAAFMAIALIIMVGIPGRTSQAVASSVE